MIKAVISKGNILVGALLFMALVLSLGSAELAGGLALADTFVPIAVTDQTPTAPLVNPVPSSFQPRYISGFGSGNSFTVFFEDRDAGNTISYASTTSGPAGFPASATATNIADTHFTVKDWPINIGGTDYAYRAWAAVGNNIEHHFYVSNDLTNWVLISTFTILIAPEFTDPHGLVYYGFHDVIQLNGTYYAFAESNQSQTMIVRSVNGDYVWEAFASIGGLPGWGPLELPAGVSSGWTPSGSFVDLGHDRGYGKIYVDPRDSNFFLAVNTVAMASLSPADLEAAFVNPANWTWRDGTTGPASSPILSETGEHDLRECWAVSNSDPDVDWVIIYDADFGSSDGGKAIGYATLTPPSSPNMDLIAGGGNPNSAMDVGSVSVSDDGTDLTVTYAIDTGDWEFVETHLHVATSFTGKSGIPQTKKGNPKVGKFDYSDPPEAPPTSQTYTIPIVDIFGDTPAPGSYTLYIAAHAAIEYTDDMGTPEDPEDDILYEESAWGEDIEFNEGKSWAMYMVYTLVIPEP